MRRLLILVGLFVGLSAAVPVNADEIDDMVKVLNQKVMKQDTEGFGSSFGEFGRDARYPKYDYNESKETAQAALTIFKKFGNPLSFSIIKRQNCGDRIVQILTVFFAEKGQYLMEYWFYRPQEKWSIATVDVKGHGISTQFVKKIKGATGQIC